MQIFQRKVTSSFLCMYYIVSVFRLLCSFRRETGVKSLILQTSGSLLHFGGDGREFLGSEKSQTSIPKVLIKYASQFLLISFYETEEYGPMSQPFS